MDSEIIELYRSFELSGRQASSSEMGLRIRCACILLVVVCASLVIIADMMADVSRVLSLLPSCFDCRCATV